VPEVPRTAFPFTFGLLEKTPGIPAGIKRVEPTSAFGQDQPTAQEQLIPAPPSEAIQPGSIQQPTFEDAAFKELIAGKITTERLIELIPNIPVFATNEEAEAANLPPGTKVIIAGEPFTKD